MVVTAPQIVVDDTWVDYAIVGIYFAFVLGIGMALRRRMKTSEDYFLSGRSLPSWVTALAFLGANLGALEILGMGAGAAQYGLMQSHFYWIGAIPAMVFVALFMLPFYYGSKTHSVPGFLRLRYNEATRGFNAVTFAVLMILMSGINMYAMAIVLRLLLDWPFLVSLLVSAGIVLAYVALGGLSSSIYNEVLQFFLITLGLVPLVVIGLVEVGGWDGLQREVAQEGFFNLWAHTGGTDNPMAVEWFGIALGLGFFLSFGYWCTDFLVVQRALAAEDMAASRRTPLIAAFPKMLYGIIAIFPGLIALVVVPELGTGDGGIENSYNMAVPYTMAEYFPSGMLGIGLTALLASFMSGMAGNVTALNTVWTHDIYRPYIRPDAPDRHYVRMGRIATFGGVLLSIGAAYIVLGFASIMDYVQLLHGVFFVPLLAVFLFGMFWRRTTPWGGFAGLITGTAVAIGIFVGELTEVVVFGSPMAGNFWRAIWAFLASAVVTVGVSLTTARKSDDELRGLVHSLTPRAYGREPNWVKKPVVLAVAALLVTLALNIVFF